MQIKTYWWEEEFEKLLRGYYDTNEYNSSDIKLLILKIIEAEKNDKN